MERVDAAALRARAVDEPLVVRPVGSQAGIGLARVESREELRAYLDEQVYPAYFVMPFVDYRNGDGFFRKYRVMFVDGKPYACHLAISPRWMIHYYNAAMAEHQWMRDEEARFIADLDAVFTGRLAQRSMKSAPPFRSTTSASTAPSRNDGRLLLFEADAAMLVHGTDPPDLYPYKRAGFERIQSALMNLLHQPNALVSFTEQRVSRRRFCFSGCRRRGRACGRRFCRRCRRRVRGRRVFRDR